MKVFFCLIWTHCCDWMSLCLQSVNGKQFSCSDFCNFSKLSWTTLESSRLRNGFLTFTFNPSLVFFALWKLFKFWSLQFAILNPNFYLLKAITAPVTSIWCQVQNLKWFASSLTKTEFHAATESDFFQAIIIYKECSSTVHCF